MALTLKYPMTVKISLFSAIIALWTERNLNYKFRLVALRSHLKIVFKKYRVVHVARKSLYNNSQSFSKTILNLKNIYKKSIHVFTLTDESNKETFSENLVFYEANNGNLMETSFSEGCPSKLLFQSKSSCIMHIKSRL